MGKETGCMDVVGKQAWIELPQGHLPGGKRKAKERSRETGKTQPLAFQRKATYIIVKYSIYKRY